MVMMVISLILIVDIRVTSDTAISSLDRLFQSTRLQYVYYFPFLWFYKR